MKIYKVLIIHDIHLDTPKGRIMWAYGRRSSALQKYAPDDFDVDICQTSEIPYADSGKYDLIFSLEYANPKPLRLRQNGFKGVWVLSHNSDANRRHKYWAPARLHSDFLIVNNQHAFDYYKRQKGTCCISNGADTDLFYDKTPISERRQKCIFAGSSGERKGKGWLEVFEPLSKILEGNGFESDFRKIDDINPNVVMPTEETADWYNLASYCLIASASEGTPNILTESVACGCVAISVPVGNILEWGTHGENCLIPDRTPESFLNMLKYAREHREELSDAGKRTIQDGWSYGEPGHRAKYFFQLFRRLIEDGKDSVKPFCYNEKSWEDI